MIGVWLEKLLNKHGLCDEENLTEDQIREEIEEETANLDNERIWNVEGNVELHEEYLEYLANLMEKAINVAHYPDDE